MAADGHGLAEVAAAAADLRGNESRAGEVVGTAAQDVTGNRVSGTESNGCKAIDWDGHPTERAR